MCKYANACPPVASAKAGANGIQLTLKANTAASCTLQANAENGKPKANTNTVASEKLVANA
jgi:hypothetical protein